MSSAEAVNVPSADVHLGDDGWMFLVGGANEVIKFYTQKDFFDRHKRQAWLELLADRQARAAQIGARYCHVIAPEKISVYPEHVRLDLPFLSSAPSHSLIADGAETGQSQPLIDVIEVLNNAKTQGDKLYFKTDTHWTPEAADAVAAAVCTKLGVPYGANFRSRDIGRANLILDLGGKCVPPVSETWHMRSAGANLKRTSANEIVAFKEANGLQNEGGLHVGSAVVFENDAPVVDARILIFGDSFSEYRDHLLSGALADNFRETHFVWASQLDWDYINALRPDFIVSELAERFMNIVPTDSINLSNFVTERLNAFKSTFVAPTA